MELSALKAIGLTDGEIKVYLALLKIGSTKTGALAIEASVSSSKVYKILERLEKKGLVSHVIKNDTKHFQALKPRRLIDYIDEESEKLEKNKKLVEKMLPSLEEQMQSKIPSEAAVFSGFKAVTNLYKNMLDALAVGEEYFVIGASYVEGLPEQKRFFQKFHQLRALKKVTVNMLARADVLEDEAPMVKAYSKIRFLPTQFVGSMNLLFYHKTAKIIVWTTSPIGFEIQSEEVVKNFKDYFGVLWTLAKK